MNTAHIHIRRILLLVAVFALAMLMMSGASALTDASKIAFTMSVDPTSLKEPGEVTVKIDIENQGEEDITTPLTLYDADNELLTAAFDGGSLARLNAGESRSWEGKWRVSQEHLDAGRIAFNLRLNTMDGAGAITQVSLEAFSNIRFEGEKVEMKVARKITPEVVRPGGTVEVVYTLENAGTVRLKDIRVRENNLISNTAQTVANIAPGGKAEVKFSKKVGNAGVESSALIEYKREGSDKLLQETVALQQIPLARPGFSAVLEADSTAITIGETVTLTLKLKNAGNISYHNIQITDPKLGTVFSDQALPAGEELILTKNITLMAPTSYKFSIALEDNSGVKQTESTNEVKVSAYEAGQVMRLNVQATPDRDSIETVPGLVRFDILVTNDSNYVAKPINVYLGNTDVRIAQHGELKPGESVTFTREILASQAGRYAFSVRTVDALDVTQSFMSNEVAIAYAPATAAPTEEVKPTVAPVVTFSPVPNEGGDSTMGKVSSALFILLIAAGVLLTGSLLLFIASSAARYRARRQSENAYDHLEVTEKRDYADPSTYQGEKAEEPEAEVAAAISREDLPKEMPHEKYLVDDKKDEAGEAEEAQAAEPADAADDAAEEGYRLTRRDEEQQEGERRTRRAAKHYKADHDEE